MDTLFLPSRTWYCSFLPSRPCYRCYCIPLAIVNILQVFIIVYNRLGSPFIEVTPTPSRNDAQHIYLAYPAYPGQEHYDSCVPLHACQHITDGEQYGHHSDSVNNVNDRQDETFHPKDTIKTFVKETCGHPRDMEEKQV